MYKARTVFNTLTPLAPRMCKPERFASWLVRSHPLTRTTQVMVAKSARKYSNRVATEPFLNGSSSSYVEEMYNAWLQDPHSVHVSWDSFFRSSTAGAAPGLAYQAPPSLAPSHNQVPLGALLPLGGSTQLSQIPITEKVIDDHLAVQAIIRSYQARGHLVADLDPLGIMQTDLIHTHYAARKGSPEQVLRQYMLEESDMDRIFKLPSTTFIGGKEKSLPLREILKRLEAAYCGHIGVEFMFINSLEQCNWIRQKNGDTWYYGNDK